MAQTTNLNVSPYFDDFSEDQDYHKVLFKPGYPVQARELTGLQSILQNQIEKFGQHFFKEGARVIPGNTLYTRNYFAVEINETHLGIPVNSYLDQLIGKKVIGQASGVSAIIDKILKAEDSERDNLTIYVQYISSGVQNNNLEAFIDGELLSSSADITSGPDNDTFIPAGESFASCISVDATSTGTSFSIADGVYFVRGQFVNVAKETIILSQYENLPSCRVGLRVIEEIINSDEDETLTDNSKGFNNYAAPGADRLKISCSLLQKPIDDFNDNNFVELGTIRNGVLKTATAATTDYNVFGDELARRTFAESGDYTVKPFNISFRNSLNNNLGNNGLYQPGEVTETGSPATDALGLYQISAGKAFVKGYEIDKISTHQLECPKPRSAKFLKSQGINYNTGGTLSVDRVNGAPVIGIGNTYVVSLRDQRQGVKSAANIISAPGNEIGVARIYDAALESGTYSATNSDTNQWDVSLYDIQPFTDISLNEAATLTVPTQVTGRYSGATGYLRSATSESKGMVLYNTKGTFLVNEPFSFDGVEDGRVAIAITHYGIKDVKSLYAGPDLGDVGFAKTFSADVIQKQGEFLGDATISVVNGTTGLSTITSPNGRFPSNVKVNDLLAFGGVGAADTTAYARVTAVGDANVTVTGITTVTGVAIGDLPLINSVGVVTTGLLSAGNLTVSDLRILKTEYAGSTDNTLYTSAPKKFIADVDLTQATMTIRKSFDVAISHSTDSLTSVVTAGSNETFLPFDEERYSLVRADGVTEVLTSDKFSIRTNAAGTSILEIFNIGTDLSAAMDATLVTTLRKSKPKAKVKKKNRVNALSVLYSNKEASGATAITLNDGLTYGNYPYGTRVQDETIAITVPDVIKIHAIYESTDSNDASAPQMKLISMTGATGKTGDLLIGEIFAGKTSGAMGIYAEKIDDDDITYISLNNIPFKKDETIAFGESQLTAVISSLSGSSRNISANYTFNNGQKGSYYDYGFITRKANASAPTRRIKIYFMSAYHDSEDKGDITTNNSYLNFNYGSEIQQINGIRNTDLIDIRPRVSNYTVAENVRSPLEFFGRSFNASGNSATNILASDESFNADIQFFVGRIDRIYLTKVGLLKVQHGLPSENPQKPIPIDDALEIASAKLPPYIFNESDVSLSFLNHKRYRMSDIKTLEDRIKNLEYYTSLSLLETATSSLFVPDADGLNRFKSGFFVDNFTSLQPQENRVEVKNSVDVPNKELRSKHYTNSIDLMFGPVATPNEDDTIVEGTNIRKNSDIVTLDYREVEYVSQMFGTRTESVTPFLVNYWVGTIDLTPASDTWVDTARVEAKIIEQEGNFAETIAMASGIFGGFDPQTGLTPVLWQSWETQWTGIDVQERSQTRSEITNVSANTSQSGRTTTFTQDIETTTFQDTFTETFETGTSTRQGTQLFIEEQFDRTSQGDKVISRDLISFMRSRNIQFVTSGLKPLTRMYAFFDGVNVTRYCVPKLLEVTMESGSFEVGETIRSLMVVGFDGAAGAEESTPHIIFRAAAPNHREGPFNAPTKTFVFNPYTSENTIVEADVVADFIGSANEALEVTRNQLPSTYSSTTTILNVDTLALAQQAQGDFFGWVEEGMTLVGDSSGAIAKVASLRLVAGSDSRVHGSFYIPSPNFTANTKWETGRKTFRLIDNPENNRVNSRTSAQETFESSGTLETVQEEIISTRNARVSGRFATDTQDEFRFIGSDETVETVSTDVTTEDVGSVTIPAPPPPPPPPPPPQIITIDNTVTVIEEVAVPVMVPGPVVTETVTEFVDVQVPVMVPNPIPNPVPFPVIQEVIVEVPVPTWDWNEDDPLAQSFYVGDATGVFMSSVDVWFSEKDDEDIPCFCHLRPMSQGYPTEQIIPLSLTSKQPGEIPVSDDGSAPTRFHFEAPVYLEAASNYCVVLQSQSTKYRVYTSRVGENDLITDEAVSQQPFLGSLFKSQNAQTWEPSQWEDLKFRLNRCEFETEGTVNLYNPILTQGNGQVPKLMPDSINLSSKELRVGLTTFLSKGAITPTLDTMKPGTEVYQTGSSDKDAYRTATGKLTAYAGIATGSMGIINAGIGYTPASGSTSYTGIAVTNISGFGRDMTINATVANGSVTAATVAHSGSGYRVGDVVGISTFATGRNARLSVTSIGGTDQLILDQVQGDFNLTGDFFYDIAVGVGTTMNGGSTKARTIEEVSDGLHFTVDHRNHGMHHEQNWVTLSKVEPDQVPTTLTVAYAADATTAISVAQTSAFGLFENVSVASSNPGYARIGEEIITYTSSASGTLSGITRGSNARAYPVGTPIVKYELGGISLRRINKNHHLSDVTTSDANKETITFDSYNVKVDMGPVGGIGRSTSESFRKLYIDSTKTTGGSNIHATQNMQYEIISPMIQNVTVPGTNLTASIRSTSGSSVNDGAGTGTDLSFINQGDTPVTLNKTNYLDSPRIIASRINETTQPGMTDLIGNRSFAMELTLQSSDSRLSPVVDGQRMSAVLTTNRINTPVKNYLTDKRVNQLNNDPTACQYISKENTLENSASSLKIILSAHVNEFSDLRAFYAISETENFEPIFTPFPGYDNLNDRGQIIALSDSSGRPDAKVPNSDIGGFLSKDLVYREYTFTANDIPSFKSFRIKLDLTSSNQAYVPRVKELRVIALA